MNPRPPGRNAHRKHFAVRRARVVGLLVLLTCGLPGCGDPDGDGGGGYVAQQAELRARPLAPLTEQGGVPPAAV